MNKYFDIGNFEVGEKLTLLGGPCVAESLATCDEIAAFLTETCDKLDINYVFKASFDKANRSSINSFRGLGIEKGLEVINTIKEKYNVPTVTDIHESHEAEIAAEVVDILQIPAFLCRQTDLLVAAGNTNKVVNIKKAQFMSARDMATVVEKVRSTGNEKIMLTERGTSFGYNNLVVDMRGMAIFNSMNMPVVFDATHSVQLPGGQGTTSGGEKEFILPLAKAAAAVGIDCLFAEIHPNPTKALSDGANSLNFAEAEKVLKQVKAIFELNKELN
ncbi:3-deoxy-8-phosphooctulonate synthase [Lentisphaerota bacterium WC36G]|nr:3-deoxy-8-phosphooctulonate synthase [Lentisphaerae bacterium WC36]